MQVVLVMLTCCLPDQGRGGGSALIGAVVDEAVRLGRARILVSTSNDDLVALALYQQHGFHLNRADPWRHRSTHGCELARLCRIPVRDENPAGEATLYFLKSSSTLPGVRPFVVDKDGHQSGDRTLWPPGKDQRLLELVRWYIEDDGFSAGHE